MQNDDIRWFLNNYGNIYKKYGKCFVAIKNEVILGKYKTALQAYNEAMKIEEPGTFVVMECRNKLQPEVVPISLRKYRLQ